MIAAAGFALMALPGVGRPYWTTFFPVVVVLGLGMTIAIAPLTATVMGAVSDRFAGTASGVNNAVARVAGLLAVAGLGVVFLAVFEAGLADRLDGLGLPPELRRELTEEAGSAALAGSLPAGDWGGRAAELRAAVQAAYLGAFRAVMLIAAALALAAGACGWAMIGGPDGRRSGRSGAS